MFSSLLVLSTLWIRELSPSSPGLAASATSLAHNHFKHTIKLKVHNLCADHLRVCLSPNLFFFF